MIEIRYKCLCMQAEAGFHVRERGAAETITDWIEKTVRPGLQYTHSTVSPFCRSNALEYIKIPVPDGTERLGAIPR